MEIKIIINIISDMLICNKDNQKDILEKFVDWCEQGAIFTEYNDSNKLEKIMYEIAPFVDNLTEKLSEYYK